MLGLHFLFLVFKQRYVENLEVPAKIVRLVKMTMENSSTEIMSSKRKKRPSYQSSKTKIH